MIRSIQFEHFRGLPDSTFNLNNKSLVLLGSNGKGKSAVVDGIEFLFSGQVGRFVGAGTGSIDHDDAVQHIKKLGIPKITFSLSPSKEVFSRSLNCDSLMCTDQQLVKDYIERHPRVDSFILRRSKILNFVCDQDADRYRKFVQLLGISHVDNLQRSFVDAERQAEGAVQRAKTAFQMKLGIFKDPVSNFDPQNLGQVLTRISEASQSFKLEKVEEWLDVENRLVALKAMRPEANKDKIDEITRALVSLESPVLANIAADVLTVNTECQKLAELEGSSVEAPRSNIITEGAEYLRKHQGDTACPLCEKAFEHPLAEVLARLNERGDALRELRETEEKYRVALVHVCRYAEGVAIQLRKDLEHSDLFYATTKQTLRNALASTLRWLRLLKKRESSEDYTDLVVPSLLLSIAQTREVCAFALREQKIKLVPPDASKLEAAIALLERWIASHAEIESAEDALGSATELARRAGAAEEAFSKARKSAIQSVFDQIASTVLDFYRRLHDFDDVSERAECTALELKSTSRAAAGGLRLAIQFLGMADAKDPRAFLSEGHLDSLGLCLFLATVRIFNPPGSLLVLDDVLTSIDREHRRRVGEILFQEFSDFQIVLTTHDEHWHDLLNSAARAWGIRNKWTFVKVEKWTIDTGPVLSVVNDSWEFIDTHLTEADYRELGGPFRRIIEDFVERTAAQLQLKVRFNYNGRYTAGDFVTAGIQDAIRKELIKVDSEHEIDICTDVGRVFGQGDLINFLSHNNPGRLEITFDQAKDFVRGVRDLTKRCEDHKLIRGR